LLDRIDGMIFSFPIYYLIKLTGYLNIWKKKLPFWDLLDLLAKHYSIYY
jgi:hypothetical protein